MKNPSLRTSRRKGNALEDFEMDAEVHACRAPCAIAHFNELKCAADLLLNASGSCRVWAEVLDRLERGDGASCPTRKSYHSSFGGFRPKLVRIGQKKPYYVLERLPRQAQGAALVRGFRKWFGDCCRS